MELEILLEEDVLDRVLRNWNRKEQKNVSDVWGSASYDHSVL